jgi:hypothetical protein
VVALASAFVAVPAGAGPLAPSAADDSASLLGGTTVVVDVLGNDVWAGTPQISLPRANEAGAAGHGAVRTSTVTVAGVERPAVAYTPDSGWYGVDTFTYTLADSTGQDSTATVTATVTPAPPTAAPDSATTPPGVQVRIPLLGNDTDPYDSGLVVTAVADPRRGSAVIDAGTAVVYRPDAGWTGVESFTYTITSATGQTARGTITVTTLGSTPGHSVTLSAPAAAFAQRSLTFSGAVDPLAGGPVSVTVQRLKARGWSTVATTRPTATGVWWVGYRPTAVGVTTWRARAVWADRSSATTMATTTVRAAVDAVVSGPLARASVPYSYRNGCPVGPSKLRRLTVNYWAYDGSVQRGDLIVRDYAVKTVRAVFTKSFEVKFRFKQLRTVDYYYLGGNRSPSGSDIAAMNGGNTSAFNCRPVTGNRYRISQHSYGNAIDINTFENPYVTWSRVYPSAARYPYYLFRKDNLGDHGVISSWSVVAETFRAFGWVWGGRWSPPDYQHFSSNGG